MASGSKMFGQQFNYPSPVQASCLNPNKCKRPAYVNHYAKQEKRYAIIGLCQRDADSGLGSSRTLEPAEVNNCYLCTFVKKA